MLWLGDCSTNDHTACVWAPLIFVVSRLSHRNRKLSWFPWFVVPPQGLNSNIDYEIHVPFSYRSIPSIMLRSGILPSWCYCWLTFSVCLPSSSATQSCVLGTHAWSSFIQASPYGSQAWLSATQASSSEISAWPSAPQGPALWISILALWVSSLALWKLCLGFWDSSLVLCISSPSFWCSRLAFEAQALLSVNHVCVLFSVSLHISMQAIAEDLLSATQSWFSPIQASLSTPYAWFSTSHAWLSNS